MREACEFDVASTTPLVPEGGKADLPRWCNYPISGCRYRKPLSLFITKRAASESSHCDEQRTWEPTQSHLQACNIMTRSWMHIDRKGSRVPLLSSALFHWHTRLLLRLSFQYCAST